MGSTTVLVLLALASAAMVQSLSFQSACSFGSRTRVLRLRGAGNDRSEGTQRGDSLHNPETVGLMTTQGLLVRPSSFDQGGEKEAQDGSLEVDGQARMTDEEEGSEEESDEYEMISEEQFEKNQRLWEAVKKGDDLEIERVIREGAMIECCDPNFGEWTAMHYAAQAGRSRIVTCLLRLGAEVDSWNERRSTPLSIAAAEGHISIVQKLVARGAVVDAPNEWGITPLHRAASAGCSKTCAKLVALGADVNATNGVGVNALHRATASGHLDTVELLLSLGADIHSQNNDGWTALHYAAQNGDMDMVEVLLDGGAKAMALSRLMEVPAHKAKRFGHNATMHLLVKRAWAEEWGPSYMEIPKRETREMEEEYEELWKGTWDHEKLPPAETEEFKAQKRVADNDGLVLWQDGREGGAASDEEISSPEQAAIEDEADALLVEQAEKVAEALEEMIAGDSHILDQMFRRIRRSIRQRIDAHTASWKDGGPASVAGGYVPVIDSLLGAPDSPSAVAQADIAEPGLGT